MRWTAACGTDAKSRSPDVGLSSRAVLRGSNAIKGKPQSNRIVTKLRKGQGQEAGESRRDHLGKVIEERKRQGRKLNVAVAEVNRAPMLTNLPVVVLGRWGRANSLAVTATDPDVPLDTLSFSIPASPCFGFNPSINANTGAVSWTCGGVEVCQVSVTVADDGTPAPVLRDTQSLFIQCTNAAPAITSIAPTAGTENTLYTYNILCTDADGDALTLMLGGGHTCPSGTLTPTGS